MEKAVVDLEIKSNITPLKKQLREAKLELERLTAEFGASSNEAINAAKNVAILKDKIGDLAQTTNAFNPDAKFNALTTSIGGALNGFQAIEGGMVLLGGESESLQKTMVKLQAVMSFSQGMQGLIESKDSIINLKNVVLDYIKSVYRKITATEADIVATAEMTAVNTAETGSTVALAAAENSATVATTGLTTAQKILRMALISTGIGAVVVLVGLLIANFDKVVGAVRNAYDSFNNLGTGVKVVLSIMFPFIGAIVAVGKALEYFGVIDSTETKNIRENARKRTDSVVKENDRAIKSAQRKARLSNDAMDFEIRKAEAMGKDTTKLEKKKAQDALTSGRAILEMQNLKIKAYENEIKALKATGAIDSERYKKIQEDLKKVKESATEQYKTNVALKQDLEIMEIKSNNKSKERTKNNNKEKNTEADKQAEIEKDRLKKLKEDLEKIEEEYRISLLTEQEKEEDAVKLKYDKLITDAKANKEDVTIIEKAKTAELKKITDKYNENARLTQEANDKLKQENDKQNLENYLTAVSSAFENEKRAIINDEKEKKILLDKALADKTITKEQYDTSIIALAKTTNGKIIELEDAQQDKINEIEEAKYQKKLEVASFYMDQISNISRALFDLSASQSEKEIKDINKKYDLQIKNAKGNSKLTLELEKKKNKEIEKEQRKAFEIKKKADYAGAIIDGAKAITSILAQYPKFDGGFAMATAIASSIITTGVSLAKISKTQFEGGGDGSVDVPSAVTQTQAPQFNVVGNSNVNQTANLGQSNVMQTYVVSSSVTNQQALDRARLENSFL